MCCFVIILLKVHLLSKYCGIAFTGYLFLLRQFQAADEGSTTAFRDDGHRVKSKTAAASVWLQRPETSRGRRFPTPRPQLVDAEPSARNQNTSVEDEGKGPFQTVKEEKKRSESDNSLTETKEKRAMDQEVEKKREHLVREKEKRMHLLQEELKREEEEEERRLREESEERLR